MTQNPRANQLGEKWTEGGLDNDEVVIRVTDQILRNQNIMGLDITKHN